ncbi:hypothetical protein BDQ12DRAFT_674043 [Crucibulum laeve]|uniref:Uncharacterized protein n=1 Tax=Crucibulum laeve TaxID=68775 RepID=A0A5C3MUK1_9AGAR|nr:hypothetical protein BDQ12DRAFT_674043 [Crucibulum laeve]
MCQSSLPLLDLAHLALQFIPPSFPLRSQPCSRRSIIYSVALILLAKSTPPRLAIFHLLPWIIPTILYALLIMLLWGVIGGYWLTFSIIMFRPQPSSS